MSRIFAIGDIHGCSKTFRKLLLEKIKIEKSDHIYCIGDYIDRGNDSKGVIDFILELGGDGYQISALRGNHEQMMMDSVFSFEDYKIWMLNGGNKTIKSFGIQHFDELDPIYKTFFFDTEFFITKDKFIFVHAGLNFKVSDPFADKVSMLWIRDFETDNKKSGNRIIIHGHTPKSLNFIASQLSSNIINIDGGCVFTHDPDLGNLVAISLPDKQLMAVKNVD